MNLRLPISACAAPLLLALAPAVASAQAPAGSPAGTSPPVGAATGAAIPPAPPAPAAAGSLNGRAVGPTAAERLAALTPVAGGWTADTAGGKARATSTDVAIRQESLRAAAARVDQALVQFFPRLSGVARYTRLSALPDTSGGFNLVAPLNPATPAGPLPTGAPLALFPLVFPVPLDNYLIQGSLTVPISDYFLRIAQAHAAASHNEEAARLDKIAADAKADADARVAFYSWVKAIGQRAVLEEALADAEEHQRDAEVLFRAGRSSKGDYLLAQSQVAAAQFTLAQGDEMLSVAEEQLRVTTHTPPAEPIKLGEDVTSDLPRATYDLASMRQEAIANRPEMRSLNEGEQALDKQATVARTAQWPALSAFGDAIYANPNQRIFPLEAAFHFTWDVGVQLTWSPNDTATATAAGAEADAGTARLRAQRMQVRDGIALEVAQAVFAMRTAEISVATSTLELSSAEEAYRVRRETYRAGQATNADLTDAESNLLRARLSAVSARIDQRVARVRLEHAAARDLPRLSSRRDPAADPSAR